MRNQVEENKAWKIYQNKKIFDFFKELNMCPQMDRDEEKWQFKFSQHKSKHEIDGYTYAEYWARLIQKKMSEGHKLEDVAQECSDKVNIPCGIDSSVYKSAIVALVQFWKYGEQLRCWHNQDVQFNDEGDIANKTGEILDPIVLSFG